MSIYNAAALALTRTLEVTAVAYIASKLAATWSQRGGYAQRAARGLTAFGVLVSGYAAFVSPYLNQLFGPITRNFASGLIQTPVNAAIDSSMQDTPLTNRLSQMLSPSNPINCASDTGWFCTNSNFLNSDAMLTSMSGYGLATYNGLSNVAQYGQASVGSALSHLSLNNAKWVAAGVAGLLTQGTAGFGTAYRYTVEHGAGYFLNSTEGLQQISDGLDTAFGTKAPFIKASAGVMMVGAGVLASYGVYKTFNLVTTPIRWGAWGVSQCAYQGTKGLYFAAKGLVLPPVAQDNLQEINLESIKQAAHEGAAEAVRMANNEPGFHPFRGQDHRLG